MASVRENWNRPVVCDAKGYVVRAHQRCEHCFILLEGLLIRERFLDKKRRQIVGLYVPGDVCGLTTLPDGHADHDVIALSPVAYIPVTRHRLSLLARDSVELSQAVLREMSRETAISAAWIVNLGQRPGYQRVAYFLCELEARLRAAGHDTGACIDWPGTQADIRAATGLSLVYVNKTLRRLQADQLVSCGRRIKIHDVAKLRAIAGFDPSYLALERETLGDMLLSRIGEFNVARNGKAFGPYAERSVEATRADLRS